MAIILLTLASQACPYTPRSQLTNQKKTGTLQWQIKMQKSEAQ